MYYYKFNIQDYLSHTMHLSEMEDLAYRRLLDWYYLHERPIPKDIDLIAKHIRMRTHGDCIANVLREFFIETDNGFESNRANSEIITYNEKSEKASKSAKARWGKNKNKNKGLKKDANALRTECEGNAIHKTLNTKQKTLNTISFDDFWTIYPRKEGKTEAEKKWEKLNVDDELFKKIKLHIAHAYTGKEKKYIPHGSTYVNQQRWNDEITPEENHETNKPSNREYQDTSAAGRVRAAVAKSRAEREAENRGHVADDG